MKKITMILIGLILLNGAAISQGQTKDNVRVRMGILQNDIHHLAFHVAKARGMFLAEGVEVEVVGIFRAGPEIMSAFTAGELDMAYVGEAPTTTAVANNSTDVVIVSQANTDGSALVVSAGDKDLATLADLKGKTVAVPGHSTVQDFLLRKAIHDQELDPGSINIIVLKPPEMIGALRTGQIDGFIAWEPYPAKAATMKVGRNLLTSAAMWNNHPCCVVVAGRTFMGKNRHAVQAVVDAHLKATEYIHNHIDEAVRIGTQFTGMDEATIRKSVENVTFTCRLNIDGEAEYVRFLNKIGYIRVDQPDQFVDRLIDESLLTK